MKQTARDSLFFSLSILAAIVVVWFTFTRFLAFSGFAVVLAKATLGSLLLYLIDKTILKQVNTLEELKKGNKAYAIYYLGYALVIASAVLSA